MRRKKTWALAVTMLLTLAIGSRADWQMQRVSIQSPFAKNVSPTNALPEYPRPQMVRPQWQNLNGVWSIAQMTSYYDALPSSGYQDILVPYCVESALSGIKKHYTNMAYRRTFSVPSSWSGKRVLLNFEAVDWRCCVYVNGDSVGGHDGGYDPFSIDITDKVNYGRDNVVAVRVYDPTDWKSIPRGKQVLSPGGIFYTSCSGIWQSVWVEAVPQTYIQDFHLTPDIDRGTLTIQAATGGTSANASTLKATAFHGDKQVATATAVATDSTTTLVLSIPNPDLWSPDHPFLYDLKLELTDASGNTDEVSSYFGMRKTSLARDKDGFYRLMLNNQFVFQTGPLDQGYWPESNLTPPTDEAMQYDIVQMKKFGFNMVRKHVTVEPRRWYYWTDRLGLMVWQDMPGMNYSTPLDKSVTNDPDIFRPELTALVQKHYNSPSIIMWVIFNEGGGQHQTRDYVNLVRSLDSTRFINEASGWTHYGYGDVLDNHPYPTPAAPQTSRAQATADGEYGGIRLVVDGHLWSGSGWGYATVKDAATYDSTLCSFFHRLGYLKTYKGMSAAVYTQLTDVEIECNGMMTYDRVVKSDQSKLYAANRRLIEHDGEKEEYVLPIASDTRQTWKYTTTQPSDNWYASDFDDSAWRTGSSGFGTSGTATAASVGTVWNTSDIWIRRTVNLSLSDEDLQNLRMLLFNDEDVEVYVNGVLAYSATGYLTDYKTVDFLSAARAALVQDGDNVFAIHCHQTTGGQFIDMGLQVQKPLTEAAVEKVIDINMDYTRSSELSFSVGYSLNPNAQEPDTVKTFTRLTFKDGEANYIGLNDGALLQPKTVRLDITDFLANVPKGSAVKYFVYVKPQEDGEGRGTIHSASLTDYSSNPDGEQLPLTLEPQTVSSSTGTILMTATTQASAFFAPRNALITPSGTSFGMPRLTWDEPLVTNARLQGYNIYANGLKESYVAKEITSYSIEKPSAAYTVTALYSEGESAQSNTAKLSAPVVATTNVARHFQGNGFSVPEVFNSAQQNATIEYWFKPDTLYANSQQVGPGWGSFLISYDQLGRINVGYENNSSKRIQSRTGSIRTGEWNHIAVTLSGSRLNLYINGTWARTLNVSNADGMPAIGDFVFGSNGAFLYGWIDDVRLWNTARSITQIQADMAAPLLNPANESGLLAYFQMDEITEDGTAKLHDSAHGHNASYLNNTATVLAEDTSILQGRAEAASVDFVLADSTIVAGLETKAVARANASVLSWEWSEPTTGLKKAGLDTLSLSFGKEGSYQITLTGYGAAGDTVSIAKTLTVTPAALPEVDFDIYQPSTTAGSPITFINKTHGTSVTYLWSLPSSTTSQSQTSFNATASYPWDGTFPVTLTATNSAGSISVTKEVLVNSGERNMSFSVEPSVILPGEATALTQQSGADTSKLVWLIQSDKSRTLILGGNTAFRPTAVGRYQITLTDSETGSSSSVNDALYVCSAPSKTGLVFRNRGESLTLPAVFNRRLTRLTIEWWMKPEMLLNAGAMSTRNGVFSISTDATGTMTVTLNNKSLTSPRGFVKEGEWHHYAVMLNSSHLYLYRDGEQQAAFSPLLSSPAWDELIIGGEQASQSCSWDELRLWSAGIKDEDMAVICNNPITDISAAQSSNRLSAYYKFDKLSSTAPDETSNHYDAALQGFYPAAGRNYEKSDGVFSLSINTPSTIDTDTDITADYLTNYQAPFRHTDTAVSPYGNAAYYELEHGTDSSAWAGATLPAEQSGVYVNTDSAGVLEYTTSWDGFSSDGIDHSLYQTITLPAGIYRFNALNSRADNTDDCLLVASPGNTLPALGNMESSLAYAPLNGDGVTFIVPRQEEVSLGVIYNLPAYSRSSIQSFTLSRLNADILTADSSDITGLTPVTAGAELLARPIGNGRISLSGDNTPVRIYTTDGRLVLSTKLKGSATLSLPAGIYIVNGIKIRID